MEGKNFVPNNTSADLMQSWHIPRPTLARSSNSSQGSTSGSTNSTQSARSGSLLLTAANLAQIQNKDATGKAMSTTKDENLKYYVESGNDQFAISLDDVKKSRDLDNVSIASSMHFTVVNVNSRPQVKTRSFCKKHQLTVLVVTMSFIFTVGIVAAIFFLEMRARSQPPH